MSGFLIQERLPYIAECKGCNLSISSNDLSLLKFMIGLHKHPEGDTKQKPVEGPSCAGAEFRSGSGSPHIPTVSQNGATNA